MPNKKNILFTELQCIDIEHVKFNAATVETLSYIFKKSSLDFLAEEHHAENVKLELKNEIIDKYINARFWKSRKPLINNIQRIFILLKQLIIKRYDYVIVMSLNTHLIVLLKMIFILLRIKVIFIAHSELELIKRKQKNHLKKFLSFKIFYFGLNKNNYRFLFLSKAIMLDVLAINQNFRKYCLYFNHPYKFSKVTKKNLPLSNNKLNFGFIGYAHKNKGIYDFLDIAKIFSEEFIFSIIGQVDNSVDLEGCEYIRVIKNVQNRDNFMNEISKLDFILMPYSKDKYNLYFSGTALDALDSNIPIIAFKNKFTEYFFNICGDIGYCVDTKEEAINVIQNLKSDFSNAKYCDFKLNLLEAKQNFTTLNNSEILFNQDANFFK